MSIFDPAQALTEGQQLIASEVRMRLSRLYARFDRIGARWAARRQAARSIRQLYRCTDRELWDMGLSRADFPAIIAGSYRRGD